MAAAAAGREVRNREGSISYAQFATIARNLCAVAGLDMPTNRGEASDLIGALIAQVDAMQAQSTEVPF